MFDPSAAHEAQKQYCQENGLPRFAPSGACWRCGRNIYREYEWPGGSKTGITVEEAGKRLITGCPHCHRSYCD